MEITEIRIKLLPRRKSYEDRLRAFCSVTFDRCFVVRDLKIIEGANGHFVAMPSRKMTTRCSRCGGKNNLRARFCNDCGAHLKPCPVNEETRLRLHADIAHPINADMRRRMESEILTAYKDEQERSTLPGYEPHSFPDLDYDEDAAEDAARP